MRVPALARFLGLSAVLACSGTAFAQTAATAADPAPDPLAEARARGQALIEEGRPSEAEQVYLEAYEATSAPALLSDVSAARLAAGDGPGAVEALERFLAAVPEGAEAEAARERIAAIEQMPATLLIASTPAGAEVRVDGQVVGATPVSVEIPPGEHRVDVVLEGHGSVHDSVVLAFASRRALDIALEAEAPPTAVAPRVEPAPEPTLERDGSATPAIWAMASISAAALLSGTIFGFKALSEESDFVLAPTEDGADRGEAYALVADLSFGVAAATAVTAFVLWLKSDDELEEGQNAQTARLRLVGASRGAGLGARVEF